FLHDLLGGLVLAQPPKGRVAQPSVAGPLGERDLCDERRLDPVHAAACAAGGLRGHRRSAPLERLEPRGERAERPLVEAGADASGVPERLAGTLAHTDEQRAEAGPGARGVGITDDHELLALQALRFEPALRALLAVAVGRAFRDDAFETQAARLAEERAAVAFDVLAVADRIGRFREQLREQRL